MNINDIRDQIDSIKKRLEHLDIELEQELKTPITFSNQTYKKLIETQQQQSIGLVDMILKTYSTSKDLTMKVRTMDARKVKVQETLCVLSSVQYLHRLVLECKEAMERREYTLAAHCLDQYLSNKDLKAISELYLNVPKGVISSDRDSLYSVSPIIELEQMRNQLTNILSDSFDTAVLNADSSTINQLFKLFPLLRSSELGLDKLSQYLCSLLVLSLKNNRNSSVDKIVQLFETVAGTVVRQEQLLTEYGDISSLIERIFRETERQALRLVEGMYEEEAIVKMCDMIAGDVDIRHLDSLLNLLATILIKTKLFIAFMQSRQTKSHLEDRMQSVVVDFVTLADGYLKRSLVVARGGKRAVDDCFFILSALISKAAASRTALCALLNASAPILETFMVGLEWNDVDTCCSYIVRLCDESGDEEIVQSCTIELRDLARSKRRKLEGEIENMFKNTIKAKIKPAFNFCIGNYVLNESEYDVGGDVSGKISGLYDRLKAKDLSESNTLYLNGLILNGIVSEWINRIFTFRFNYLGALRLDRDVRDTMRKTSARESFQKLVWLCVVLSVEKIEDVMEFRTRLEPSEVKRILALRVEFNRVDIEALP